MQIPKGVHKYYIHFISQAIWTFEKYLFYPKLESFYSSFTKLPSSKLNANKNKPVIFDVGANKGQSIRFFKKLFPEAEIHAFEPSPNTYMKLEREIMKHSYSSTNAYPIGVSETKASLPFYESILDETSSFDLPDPNSKYLRTKNRILLSTHAVNSKPKLIKVNTLENIVRDNRILVISILKIDAEGHELSVLKGATNLLRDKQIHMIQFERHRDDMRPDHSEEISKLLEGFGYVHAASIKHPFGSFYEEIYMSPETSL